MKIIAKAIEEELLKYSQMRIIIPIRMNAIPAQVISLLSRRYTSFSNPFLKNFC